MFKKINTFVTKHQLFKKDQTVIVGLSGGPDSLFLLHYLVTIKNSYNLKLIAVHLDHEWRKNSNQDVIFCKKICAEFKVPFTSKKLSELSIHIKPSGSKEQDARKARRYFFEQIAKEHDADAIALAQHKDDQEETFFIRLLRGASLTGLCGMWPKKGLYIRPLLTTSKKEIVTWLNKHHINYLIDPTNISDDFLRNRIRNKLIPTINEIDPRFSGTLAKTMQRLQQTENFLKRLTIQTFDHIAQLDEKKIYIINKKDFLMLDPILQYRILVHWLTKEKVPFPITQGFLDEIIRFLKQPENKIHTIAQDWHIVKKQNIFYIQT
ncbi:MAG: tRNA lysidine(34) synthetase TilS [Candidatus Dependentiae bacterium]